MYNMLLYTSWKTINDNTHTLKARSLITANLRVLIIINNIRHVIDKEITVSVKVKIKKKRIKERECLIKNKQAVFKNEPKLIQIE